MKEKVIRIAIIDVAFVLGILSLCFSMFSLGFVVKGAVQNVKEEMESVEVTEDIEPDFYYEDIPLEYDEQRTLYDASVEFGVDYYTMLGLIEQETNFRNISGDGGKASGYCQIWRVYWSDLMEEIGASDLNVPEDNFRTACAIVAELTDRHGSLAGALTAYNKGSYDGTVSRYAVSVLENAEKWRNA